MIHHVVQGHDIDIGSSTLHVRHRLRGPGVPRRLPHPHGRAVPHRLPGPGLQRQAGPGGDDLARAPPALDVTRTARPGRPGRAARRAPVPRGRLAGAGRGGDAGRARGGRGGPGRPAGRGRHPGVPDRPPRRRLALGAWDNDYPPAGEGKAGLHVDTIAWMHERRIAAFLPDGDGETVPSNVEGMLYPIHPLQVTAMGMFASDSLQLEDVAAACAEEGRFEFMVVGLPLRLPGATGSPVEPDRDLLRRAVKEAHGAALRGQGRAGHRRDDRHRAGDRGPAGRRRRAGRRSTSGPGSDPRETLGRSRRPAARASRWSPTCATRRRSRRWCSTVAERGGRLDYVVSNAAINPFMTWDETTHRGLQRAVRDQRARHLGGLHRGRQADDHGGPRRRDRAA